MKADIKPEDHEERLAVARSYCQWHLGSPGWADDIVDAYLWPEQAKVHLEKDKSKYDK